MPAKTDCIDAFRSFHKKAAELRESKLLPQILSVGVKMKWNNESGLSIVVKKPDETDLRAYLTTFRQFMMEKERVCMKRIYEALQELLTDATYKEYLAKSKTFWQNANDQAGVLLIYNGKQLTPLEITNLFLYGGIFHSDVKKEKFLDSLLPHERDLFTWQFLEFVQRATQQIFCVDNIV